MKRVKRERIARRAQLAKRLYDLYMKRPENKQHTRPAKYLSIVYSLSIPQLQYEIELEQATQANNEQRVNELIQKGEL